MDDIHEEAAETVDTLAGRIWQRQMEIVEGEIQDTIDTSLEGPDDVKRNLQHFHDLDDIPDEYRELDRIRDRLDGTWHALRGRDLAADEERFSTDPTPDEDDTERFLETMETIDHEDIVELDEEAIETLEDAIDDLFD